MEIAVVAGFAAFLGKYLEQQFNLTTSSANQLLGMTAIPCACLGIFLGGLLVKKLSLSALGAIRMAMLVNLVSTACYVSFLFLGCDTGPVAGVTVPYGNTSAPGSALDPYSPCNKNCECQTDSFTPVCGADGITYLSACFAGCSSTNLTGCACLTTVPPENTTVVPGKCPSPGCQEAFLTFLCVMCVCSMIGAMAQTPSVIILIRTVSPELKSYALGVLFLLLRLLGMYALFIPSIMNWMLMTSGKGQCGSGSFPSSPGVEVETWLVVSVAGKLKGFCKKTKFTYLFGTKWKLKITLAIYISKPTQITVITCKKCPGSYPEVLNLKKFYRQVEEMNTLNEHFGRSTEYQDIETEKTCPESHSPSEDSFNDLKRFFGGMFLAVDVPYLWALTHSKEHGLWSQNSSWLQILTPALDTDVALSKLCYFTNYCYRTISVTLQRNVYS
ncbi:solute carrier organic anion transporter family member 3A1-like [Leptonychotes weddellii]|uniref:Solute carrier organic anion transporter family member 3A1-like n=1 Tax=Leptonychotes weddellii TaxID=9713 RepID=A0A7F8QTE6_LEPWE|nr:solute carrier organic anion transporter family member 3A1-like [Leptonychotes weddellii]